MLPTPTTDNVPYDKVYEPAEDSFLLLDALESERDYLNSRFSCPVVLEVGAGSGILSVFVSKSVLNRSWCLSTDINPYASESIRSVSAQNQVNWKLDVVSTSLGACLRPRCIDLLIFNPPYVPSETVPENHDIPDSKLLDLALDGGENGMEITNQLLANLDYLLSENGVAYILFCASNDPANVEKWMNNFGWIVDIVMKRRAGWEILTVMRFRRG